MLVRAADGIVIDALRIIGRRLLRPRGRAGEETSCG